jgi:hypothetical protein
MPKFIFLTIALFLPLVAASRVVLTSAQKKEAKKILHSWWAESDRFSEDVLAGEVVSWANVDSQGNQQSMRTRVVGVHPRSCTNGLRRISLYENYPKHIDYIKQASYDEGAKRVRFVLDHALLPFPMELVFHIPRIRAPGSYPFTFPGGIFKGLTGSIRVESLGARCLYYMETDWAGATTKIPDTAVQVFAQTLSRVGLEKLIRMSTL